MQPPQHQMALPSNAGLVGQPTEGVQLQMTPFVVGTQSNVVTKYKHRQSKALGLTLIICGALSIVANIIDLVVYAEAHHKVRYRFRATTMGVIGHGFWCGVVCIIAGGLGVGASKSKTRCTIVGFMVMSIIAACLCLGQLITAAIGVSITSYELRRYTRSDYYHPYYGDSYHAASTTTGYPIAHEARTIIAMEALLLTLALVSGVAGIWASAICCQAVCCGTSTPVVYGVVQYTPMNAINQQGQAMPVTYMVPAPSQYPVQPGQQFVSLPPYNSQPTAVMSNVNNPPAYGVEFQATGGGQDNTGLPEKC